MKICILDKDGTLIKPKSGEKFVQNPLDQEILPGVKEKIEQLKKDGWLFAIATNQGGVEAGHKTLASAVYEVAYVMELLTISYGILAPSMEKDKRGLFTEISFYGNNLNVRTINDKYFLYRKPNPAMLKNCIGFYTDYYKP